MLEVYDRVIPSGSVPTLIALLMLVAGLYAFSGLLDILRSRVMIRIAGIFDATLSPRILFIIAGIPLLAKTNGDALKPAQEADQIRAFLSGPGPLALFDLPWMPIYLAICFFLHPLIGWLAAAAMSILVVLTVAGDFMTRSRTRQMASALSARNKLGEAIHRNVEAIAAMGLLGRTQERWQQAHEEVTELQQKTGDIAALLFGLSKTVRQLVQSGSLALGAWLVVHGDMTGGTIVAASIIVARALQPIEQVIANWRNMVAARQAWQRLKEVFKLIPDEQGRTALPAPSKSLSVEAVFIGPPGERQRMAVQNVSFRAQAGTVIGIIGPSASGKSSLVRAITGVWPLVRGQVRLDGATLDQWSASERGRHIGYMPQNSDLFPGSIAENIARLHRNAKPEDIIAAAHAAGVHEMIVALPEGYETQVGDNGVNLSAGQRQRVTLARALYGNPFLVVLDEPNSNLDAEGDRALSYAIAGVRNRGGIVLVVAHRNSVLSQLDYLLVMENGVAKSFGPRDAVLKALQQQRPKPQRTSPVPSLTVIEGDSA